ncbi:hypothetical protein P9875_08320 [Janthinobacterium rivuli]|uniref:Uncharacterized protein n=1 Tax=Janthinobacterium rivuli TaxID=2751478 RepID=A0ABY8I9K7_9BURK|nr:MULTISPECIES: hypothetical protein [Janthinobacterium]NVI82109.1 hypothetical protein [Janthinobacterium sp. BJB401]PHV34812.1 hypothetical protein CSQ94_05390 [Janthinobacterium sp. BJB312]WFR81159.1 hypothetical protein P9875_08320 [Janthinobacterium rivuli]
MQAIHAIALCLLLSCAANVRAANYCDSPRWSIVHNKSYDEVMKIATKRDKIRDAECSFTDVILRIQNEEAGIGRYPGILLIADAQDERFVVTSRVGAYTIFSYRYNDQRLLQFAMQDHSWEEGEAFQAGAYKITGIKEFKTLTGFPATLLVVKTFQFYGPK